MKDIYVVDTETTGLSGYPNDFIVEIAICKIIKEKEIVEIYNSVVGHDTKNWPYYLRDSWIFSNSDLTLHDVQKAKNQAKIVKKVREILNEKTVTSFNFDYDFRKFLFKSPWKLGEIVKSFPCIMLSATNFCKIPGYYDDYKWPSLYEAYATLCKGKIPQSHRAMDDAIMASNVLVEILKAK